MIMTRDYHRFMAALDAANREKAEAMKAHAEMMVMPLIITK